MPEHMLMYRAGAFFAKMYASHLLSGIPSIDEVIDSPTATIVSLNDAPARAETTEGELEKMARSTSAKKQEKKAEEEPPPADY